jgi:RNA polymerase sigma-70 factor (ECF subfamily)
MNVSEYNQCVDDFSDGLYRFILKHTRDSEKARDVVQESFAKLWQKVDEVDFAKSKSYLFSTGYHTMIDQIRKEKRRDTYESDHRGMTHTENSYSDLNEILHEALDKLTDIQKSVVLLRDYEGYSYQEIGEITNLNESQVKVYIYRARVALKEYLVSIDYVI